METLYPLMDNLRACSYTTWDKPFLSGGYVHEHNKTLYTVDTFQFPKLKLSVDTNANWKKSSNETFIVFI